MLPPRPGNWATWVELELYPVPARSWLLGRFSSPPPDLELCLQFKHRRPIRNLSCGSYAYHPPFSVLSGTSCTWRQSAPESNLCHLMLLVRARQRMGGGV